MGRHCVISLMSRFFLMFLFFAFSFFAFFFMVTFAALLVQIKQIVVFLEGIAKAH